MAGISKALSLAHVLLLDDFVDVVGHVGEVRFDLKVHTAGLKGNKTTGGEQSNSPGEGGEDR